MKMIPTGGSVGIASYPDYVHDCQRNPACEPAYAAPLPGVPYVQLYVDFGTEEPTAFQVEVLDLCDPSHTEQIFPSNYVVGRTPDATWYGVFKFFTSPVIPIPGSFVVWLSALVDTADGLQERTFFSEILTTEPCLPLMKIASCHPEGATSTGYDVNDVYYGLPQGGDYLGTESVRYFHIAYVRRGKVKAVGHKATFVSNLTRNFRTTIERTWLLMTEFVPQWYKDVLLAIYARGAIQVDGGRTYLVSDLAFEPLNDNDLTWKPYAQLKATQRLYFGCDASVCTDCCSPRVIFAFAVGGVVPTTNYIIDAGGHPHVDANGDHIVHT